MIGFGMATAAVALLALWLLHRNSSLLQKRWVGWVLIASIFGPFLGNSFGWIFTEMGRQPWVGLRPDVHQRRGVHRARCRARC